jgi:hypothetical protein
VTINKKIAKQRRMLSRRARVNGYEAPTAAASSLKGEEIDEADVYNNAAIL